ncbi:MAG TPA: diguanylate cyclase [Solirubrobacteraceae bacterium]|nr:diguanylate cyclase [Solirubrobacteraceae bacterium]
MDEEADEGATERAGEEEAPDPLLVAPAAVLEGLPDAVVAAARDGRIVFVNALAEEMFGYPKRELIGQPVTALWPERVRERYSRNMELYFATEHPMRFSTAAWGLRRDGSEFIGEMSWGIIETSAGPLLLAVGRDISEQRAAEARLRAVAAMGGRALAGADPTDLAGEAIERLVRLLPVAAAEVRLADGSALASRGPDPETGLRFAIGTGDELLVVPTRPLVEDELSFVRALANTLATALARLRDEERMRHEAVHDPLTGLANRTLLRDRLEHALARSERERGATAVLFVDLDNFKHVNDAYGHAAGDAALVELGKRLQTAIRPGDTIARIGGDEFVAVCEHVDENSAFAVSRRLLEAIQRPFAAGDVQHELSASIGIALGHADADALLANADAATYRAKAAGRGRIELSER